MTKNNNLVWHHATIKRADREKLNGHRSAALWFTGLSGAGKSTLAHAIEEKLYHMGCRTFVFDGTMSVTDSAPILDSLPKTAGRTSGESERWRSYRHIHSLFHGGSS